MPEKRPPLYEFIIGVVTIVSTLLYYACYFIYCVIYYIIDELLNTTSGVGIGTFKCSCGRQYTVRCKRNDTARCFNCGKGNYPSRFGSPRRIERKTNSKHECSQCNGRGNCPNMR